MNLRILFVGENWHGSNATSCMRAFRYLDCDVHNLDEFHYFPRWTSIPLRILRKLVRQYIKADFANQIRAEANIFRPELVFIFKGTMVFPAELRYLHSIGAKIVLFYPDVNLESHYRNFGNNIWECVPEYDVFFTPKLYQIHVLKERGSKRVEFLPYAYDPWCHFPIQLSEIERSIFKSEVSFIGSWGSARESILEHLVGDHFPHELTIWGNQWDRLDRSSPLRRYVKFAPANGMTQAKVFNSCKIALAFLSPPDLHTARSFEIPAYGGFMLAERTSDHLAFFKEDQEIACFEGIDELRSKIDYYLTHDEERQKIAQAGFLKVTTGGHSYVDRMKTVLQVYHEL